MARAASPRVPLHEQCVQRELGRSLARSLHTHAVYKLVGRHIQALLVERRTWNGARSAATVDSRTSSLSAQSVGRRKVDEVEVS